MTKKTKEELIKEGKEVEQRLLETTQQVEKLKTQNKLEREMFQKRLADAAKRLAMANQRAASVMKAFGIIAQAAGDQLKEPPGV